MSISKLIHSSTLIASLISLSTINNVAYAVTLDFSTWTTYGDVTSSTLNGTSLSNNALSDDDSPQADSNFNFSGNAAIDSSTLETNLGLTPESLAPDTDNFIQATEGSGLTSQLTFDEPTILSFDWQFLTNDTTFVDSNNLRYTDYGFFSLDGTLNTIASTDSILNPSKTNYDREATGTSTQLFLPGTYDLAIGIVDVDNFARSSALIITEARATSASTFESNPRLGLILLASLMLTINFYKRYCTFK